MARCALNPRTMQSKKYKLEKAAVPKKVAVIGGGAGWYFKIYRPKHEKAAEPEEDYGGELPDYDGAEDYGDEEDGPPWDEEDDDGEGADE